MSFDLKKIFSEIIRDDGQVIKNNISRKLYYTGHEELNISASCNETADKVSKLAYSILQKYKDNPQQVLKMMKGQNTKVVFAEKLPVCILKFLGYKEGFIPKHTSFQALLLNCCLKIFAKEKLNISLSLPDLFIICKKDLSLYMLAYEFHHWLSYKYQLPGYDYKTMNLFNKTFNTKANLSLLSINQMIALKDTIEREKQALDFVRKFVREQVGAKERLTEMLSGKNVSI